MNSLYREFAKTIIMREESFKADPYLDVKGVPTIGYGTVIGVRGTPLSKYSLTVTHKSASALLEDYMSSVCDHLDNLGWFAKLNDQRKAILVSCAYQVGYTGLLEFKRMIAALEKDDYDEAAKEMLDSRVARKTAPARWKRAAEIMRTGSF